MSVNAMFTYRSSRSEEWSRKSEVTMRTGGTGRPKLQTRLVLYQCLDSINLGRRRGIRVMSVLWQTGAATASWLGEESKGVRVGRLRW
ncbi:hypothetical protein CFAM422_005982 [Trichoderma lentiforme]|uniref:Uncharacterized protein n=1 Tax=Trichoderma lentiforme TaxID=1567552 RepID=A0A9P5CE22_9HYPO|nr:hypothetical protein CFAM422_005982 [Trichoderma lentiforme]